MSVGSGGDVGSCSIVDPDDPRIEHYRNLNDPAGRTRTESAEGVFVVEGRLALEQLVAPRFSVESVLVTPNRLDPLSALLAGLDAPVYVAPRAVLAATVGFDLHRGVVAVGRRLPAMDAADAWSGAGAVLVLEGINDHENLGALFRNARALGAGAVLLDPTCADPLYRRSIRVSLGHVLRVPFAPLAPWPEGLSALRAAGFRLVGLTPDPRATPIDEAAAAGSAPVALLIGAEGPGLTPEARAEVDAEVRIPMAGGVDSLNVATAAAIALHRLAGPGLG